MRGAGRTVTGAVECAPGMDSVSAGSSWLAPGLAAGTGGTAAGSLPTGTVAPGGRTTGISAVPVPADVLSLRSLMRSSPHPSR